MSEVHHGETVITMYTTVWCPDCWRAKMVFKKMGISYREVDLGKDPEAAQVVQRLNNGHRSVPTILFPDGSVLTEPSTAELVAKLRQWTDQVDRPE